MANLPTKLYPSGLSQQLRLSLNSFPLWWTLGILGTGFYFLWPGGYANTAHDLLHGLCAQTPSHGIEVGGEQLPLDARCIGIFGGALITFVGIVRTKRLFFYGAIPMRVILPLVFLLVLMAMDGVNSLLSDLGMWHPWPPTNLLRLTTGFGVGVGLAVALGWLVGSTTWHLSSPEPGIQSLRQVWFALPGFVLLAVLLWWAPGWMHVPIATALVFAVWLCVALLVMVSILLLFRIDGRVTEIRKMHIPGATAAVLAVGIMIGLASLRFWIERMTGFGNTFL